MRNRLALLAMSAALALPGPAVAQEGDSGRQTLEVGQAAPDTQITGATRFGVLRDPVRLSDFRGKTVVLAFFFRARTKG